MPGRQLQLAARYAAEYMRSFSKSGTSVAGIRPCAEGLAAALTGQVEDARREGKGLQLSELQGDRFTECECRSVLGFVELSGTTAGLLDYLGPLPDLQQTMGADTSRVPCPSCPISLMFVAVGELDEAMPL